MFEANISVTNSSLSKMHESERNSYESQNHFRIGRNRTLLDIKT